MRRPLGCVCLCFLMLLGLFYVFRPPRLPDYSQLENCQVYVYGKVTAIRQQEIQRNSYQIYELSHVKVLKDIYTKDKSNDNAKIPSEQIVNGGPEAVMAEETVYEHDKIYCYSTDPGEKLSVGCFAWFRGNFSAFDRAENPGQFDVGFYYHILQVGGSLWQAECIWKQEPVWSLAAALERIKGFLGKRIEAVFEAEYAGILKTMLLGDRSMLDGDTKYLFQKSGILHILAISGLHIHLLGMGMFRLLRKGSCPPRTAAVLSGIGILLYGGMTGMQTATCRAVCMFLLQMGAVLSGRTYDSLTGLALAAVLLILEQPLYLFYSGFLLSFGAVLGVSVITPVLMDMPFFKKRYAPAQPAREAHKADDNKGRPENGWKEETAREAHKADDNKGRPEDGRKEETAREAHKADRLKRDIKRGMAGVLGALSGQIRQALAAGLGIFVMTFPIQLFFYYEYPLYSIAVNLLVLPLLPYVIGFGLLAAVLPVWAAAPCTWIAEGILRGYEGLCGLSQKLPFHTLILGAPKGWQMAVYYGAAALWLFLYHKKAFQKRRGGPDGRHKKTVLCLCCLVSGIALSLLLWRPVKGLTCMFLSVGQGDCSVIRYGGSTYIVDCGSSSKGNVGTNILLPCLKYYGIREVDGIFLSHEDMDHVNGIVQWLESYEEQGIRIHRILLPAWKKELREEAFREILTLAERYEIPVTALSAGETLSLGALTIEVLYPEENTADYGTGNAFSQVLYFAYEGKAVLYTGDIGADEEEMLAEAMKDRTVTILKAAHHGSGYSNSQPFLEACMPEQIVISYGKNNLYGHPHKEALQRMEQTGAEIFKTAEDGAVIFALTR